MEADSGDFFKSVEGKAEFDRLKNDLDSATLDSNVDEMIRIKTLLDAPKVKYYNMINSIRFVSITFYAFVYIFVFTLIISFN